MIDWHVAAESFSTCNCDHACPCQFEGLPTHNSCMGFEVFRVEQGHFGEVDLSGVVAGVVFHWPGPIFEGKGTMQAFVDESASPAQQEAIFKIVRGEETREAANHWWVFHAMSDHVLEDQVVKVDFSCDREARTASVSIPGMLEATGEPIRNPLDGNTHRVQIRCPEGIEFDVADIGNSNSETTGDIRMSLKDTYGQFNRLDHTGNGPAHVQ